LTKKKRKNVLLWVNIGIKKSKCLKVFPSILERKQNSLIKLYFLTRFMNFLRSTMVLHKLVIIKTIWPLLQLLSFTFSVNKWLLLFFIFSWLLGSLYCISNYIHNHITRKQVVHYTLRKNTSEHGNRKKQTFSDQDPQSTETKEKIDK
jgi:hypothetical protein